MNEKILNKNPVITICAPRNSGKSFLIRELLKKFSSYWDNIIIFCPTLKFNEDYDDLGENARNVSIYRVAEFDKTDINKIFKDHEESKEKCIQRKKEIKKNGRIKKIRIEDEEGNEEIKEERLEDLECPKTLVIFDDVIDSGVLKFHGIVDKYAERGRHVNISCIISSQRISAVSRSIRINSDLFITFSPYCIAEFEQFAEKYISKKRRKAFLNSTDKLFDERDYLFVYVDNSEKKNKMKLKRSDADNFIKGEFELVDEII